MKGIAIQTILLLLIGVLVAGIVIFIAYRSFSGSALSEQECRQKVISWCNVCALGNYESAGLSMGPDVAECLNKYFSSVNTWEGGDWCIHTKGGESSATICPQFLAGT